MQTKTNQREKSSAQSGRFSKRIGSTVFTVNVHFKEESRETLEDKILRLMQSDLRRNCPENSGNLQSLKKDAIIGLPQADWLPERGAL
jgi:hypothetical protein